MNKMDIESGIDEIKIGTGVTSNVGSDSYPYVVVRKSAKCVYVKAVKTGPNRRHWPNQDFPVYLDQPEGPEIELRFTVRNTTDGKGYGGWRSHGRRFSIGHAYYYQDPSF